MVVMLQWDTMRVKKRLFLVVLIRVRKLLVRYFAERVKKQLHFPVGVILTFNSVFRIFQSLQSEFLWLDEHGAQDMMT
jgi:hypothetical protein